MSQHTLWLLRFTYKKLKEKLNVSDSKKLFHEQFPYVIPGLYKRLVDEMIVELNLLNHQIEFSQDYLFCYGIIETFKELTRGYQPEDHLNLLFESLCNATNFDSKHIKEVYEQSKKEFNEKSLKEITNLFVEKNKTNLYPSRILNLGVFLIISNSKEFKDKKDSEKNDIVSENIKSLNLPIEKAEKDIGLYKSSITKLKQAKELIEETKTKTKGKKS